MNIWNILPQYIFGDIHLKEEEVRLVYREKIA